MQVVPAVDSGDGLGGEVQERYGVRRVQVVLRRANLTLKLGDDLRSVIDHPLQECHLLGVLHLHDEVVVPVIGGQNVDDAFLVVLVLGDDLGVEERDVNDVDILDDAVKQPDCRVLEPLGSEDPLEREVNGGIRIDVLCLHSKSGFMSAKLR